MKLPWARRDPADISVAEQARKAFQAGVSDATFDLSSLAAVYLRWAEAQGGDADRAEALWMLTVGAARDAMRRRLPADRARLLADAPANAALAGYHHARNGRVEQAVTTLEHSRAIQLTRQLGRLDDTTRRLLLDRGGAPLLEAYLAALRRRGDTLRRDHDPRPDTQAALRRGEQVYEAGELSPAEAAQAEVIRLGREILGVAGEGQFLEIPSLDTIRRAAAVEPLLYLAAMPDTGYALLVTRTGPPRFHELPGLTTSRLDRHAAAHDPAPCVDELAGILGPLLDRLPPGWPGVGLIALGRLAALPVHAAILQATAGRAGGPLAPRHLPNARFAHGVPALSQVRRPSLLIAAVPQAPGATPLKHALAEAEHLHARHGGAVLPSPDAATVLGALGGADIAHFICHGIGRPGDPLGGGLLLTDGLLTVQTLMTRPPERRQLVIICACEGGVSGDALPDEVVGLPSALLQAGAAAVIAAQWTVEERMALLLLRRVHEALHAGERPAVALAKAQVWLRGATRGELESTYPDLYRDVIPAVTPEQAAKRAAHVPYGSPRAWAAFTYTGE